MHHHHPGATGGGGGPSAGGSVGRAPAGRGKGLRFMLVCLVFGVGFFCGIVAMWARPQATKSGTAIRGAVRHADDAAQAHQHHGFVKPVGIDHADHEGLAYDKKKGAKKPAALQHDAADAEEHPHSDDGPHDHHADHAASHGHDDHEHHQHDDAGDDANHHHGAGDHDAESQHHHHDHHSGGDTSHSKDATDTEAEAAHRAKLLAAVPPDSIEAEAIRRAVGGTLFVIPVNDGYIDFGLNLLCSMERLGLFRGVSADGGVGAHSHDEGERADDHHHHRLGQGYIFVAMDELALDKLQRMGLPVIKDPDVPFVSSKSAAWGDPKFHQLVCTKLIPVLRFLKAGLNVILSDADIVFRKDPYPFVRRDLGMTFTIGSCHKDLPDNFNLASNDGLAKLNTGFYHAVSSPGVISLLSRALENCKSSHLTGDQPAINTVLHDDQNKGLPGYTYGFFDGCLFANGCIFFKHLCANTSMPDPRAAIAAGRGSETATKKVTSHKLKQAGEALPAGHIRRDDPVMVHANFLVGKKDKVKHLRRYDLWADACIALWRGNVTEAPTTAAAAGAEAKAAVKKPKKRVDDDV